MKVSFTASTASQSETNQPTVKGNSLEVREIVVKGPYGRVVGSYGFVLAWRRLERSISKELGRMKVSWASC